MGSAIVRVRAIWIERISVHNGTNMTICHLRYNQVLL